MQVERETGTKVKETRKYVFQSLSELNRITLPGNRDHDDNGVIGQMDRSEFVSFLSSLLRIDPSSRITPQHALQKPFITMYHLSAHSTSPVYVCLFIYCNHSYCVFYLLILPLLCMFVCLFTVTIVTMCDLFVYCNHGDD